MRKTFIKARCSQKCDFPVFYIYFHTLVRLASRLSEQCGLAGSCFGGHLFLSRIRTGVAAMGQDCNYQLGRQIVFSIKWLHWTFNTSVVHIVKQTSDRSTNIKTCLRCSCLFSICPWSCQFLHNVINLLFFPLFYLNVFAHRTAAGRMFCLSHHSQ